MWGNWARGNRISQSNVLARMIQQKMEDIAPSGISVDGFPLYIEIIDKAVAKLRVENEREYKLVMKYYLGRKTHDELADYFERDNNWVKGLHVRAIHAVARIKREVTRQLTGK
jgi:transposase